MRRVGGELLVTAFTATYVAGCFASAMVSQASVSRVLFAMGRDGALPRVFGKLVSKKRVPATAIMLVSLFSLIALFITLDTVANMISFGALFAFSAVNLAVIKHYLVDQKLRGTRNYLLYARAAGPGVPQHHLAVDQPVQHVVHDRAVLDGVGADLFDGRYAGVPGEDAGVADGAVINGMKLRSVSRR